SLSGKEALRIGDSPATLALWDLKAEREVRQFRGHLSWPLCAAFTPDGRRVVSGGWDTTVRMWDAGNGQEVRTFVGHLNRVRAVAVSADGRYAVSGSLDGTARVWSLPP